MVVIFGLQLIVVILGFPSMVVILGCRMMLAMLVFKESWPYKFALDGASLGFHIYCGQIRLQPMVAILDLHWMVVILGFKSTNYAKHELAEYACKVWVQWAIKNMFCPFSICSVLDYAQ